MPLLHLLLVCLIHFLLLGPLMLLVLLRLQLLPILFLLLLQLFLLLLVFLIQLFIPGVRRCRTFSLRNVPRVDYVRRWRPVSRSGLTTSSIGGRIVGASSFAGGLGFAASELSGPSGRGDWRLAVICRSSQFRIPARRLNVLHLSRCRRNMPLTLRFFLLRRGPRRDPTFPAVVAHSIFRAVDDRLVVDVVNVGDVDIGHRPVVEEVVVIPASTGETISEIAEAVVYAAVETHVRAPVPLMKKEHAAFPSPEWRRPQKTDFRGENPGARHPEVVAIVVT